MFLINHWNLGASNMFAQKSTKTYPETSTRATQHVKIQTVRTNGLNIKPIYRIISNTWEFVWELDVVIVSHLSIYSYTEKLKLYIKLIQ